MGNDWLSPEQRKLLDRMLDDEGVDRGESPVVARGGDRSALPLSFAQQRMWFFHRLQPTSTMYNIVGAATMRGRTDPAVLQRCLDELVRRHEVLRSTFHLVDAGNSVQRVNPPSPVPMPVVDLRDLDPAARDEAVRTRYQEEIDRPFDLTRDVLLRPTLLRVADDEHLLLLSQHHIATDGWSLGILLQELAALYDSYAADRAPTLPEPDLHYGDFALWQREWQATGALDEHLKYWRERLTGAHALDLPTGRLRVADRSWDGGMCEVHIPAGLVGALKALGESERATLFMVLLAGVSTVLSRWTGQQDLVVGVPVANRNRGEIESMVGSFVNTLPMRIELTGEPTFRELLRHVRQEAVDGYAHQDVPFEKIIEEINPEREASAHTPLIRHMLGLHNTPWRELRVPDLTVDILTLDTGKARFDLEFELTPTDDGAIAGQLWFAADIMDEVFARRLLESVYSVLAAAVADPETPVWRLPLMPAAQAPAESPVRVDAAAADPAAIVVLGDRELTGAEFAERVTGLANELRSHHGVVEGSVVALVLPHTADLAVALHAVLAAGAVALPLDPALTRAEITAAIDRTSPTRVLTTEALAEVLGDGAVAVSALDPSAADPLPPRSPDAPAVCLRSRGGTLSTHSYADLAARVRALATRFPADAVAVSPSVSPDVLVTALLWPAVAGGAVVLGASDRTPDLLLTTPAHLPTLTAAAARVITTGEQLWPDAATAFARAFPDAELVTLYALAEAGPVAAHVVDPDAPAPSGRIPVGSPLGARPRVCDERGEPVPDGVAGDLRVLVDGAPVATGDRARWNTAGDLEILGKPDGRTVVHGRPVELGDLAAELTAHPAVSRAHFSRTEAGELIAHAVPRTAPPAGPDAWRERFVQGYLARDPESDPLLNLTGWRSPNSDAVLPAAALREWLDGGVRHILDTEPRRVLEIGCRNGQLLFRLAPRCDAYRATELSGRARRSIERQRDRLAAKADVVELADLPPDDLTGLGGDFDTVVVNGLAGYCPDPGYLERVLAAAVAATRPGGAVFVSDVVDLTARQALHLPGVAARTPADAPASRLREAVARQAAATDGLALHPDWFREVAARLPGVRDAAVLRRVGTHSSELTRFRFDVVLHVARPDGDDALPPVQELDWVDVAAAGLTDHLASAPDLVVLHDIPVSGLVGVAAALDRLATADTAGEVRRILDAPAAGVDPADVVATAAAMGFDAVAGPSGSGFAGLTMALRRQGTAAVPLSRVLAATVVAQPSPGPLAGDTAFAEWARSMPAVLRGWLRDRLPLNAVPASVEPVTAWPHRPDGAVDTAAFTVSASAEPEVDEESDQPRTPTQKTVLTIWSDILGVDHMGVDDDFFALGGHSLMGALVVDRLREEFALDLPLGQLFQTPTVAEVAEYIDGRSAAEPAAPPTEDVPARPEPAAPIRALDRSSFRRKRSASAPAGTQEESR
ncbi:condensation domain-containing protein [Umezawaea sp. Da 62-37]|uniref:condensation domain-containing protein n=1 Tax=Umezawaea sp. Da 62-37 TaxID=3075927 RepID=UPI0028F6E15F|nr:condensation domain-containing protein [Umezawaea sp. Da 62-37]WNV85488.1 condensation domain-containing protein [Umezawaea sp. Da 62-37]